MKIKWIIIVGACLVLLFFLMRNANYSSKKAIKNGDVVLTHSEDYNLDTFFDFLEKERQKIRIVLYTDEGDSIITDLSRREDDSISFRLDNSKDKFSKRDIQKGVCSNITQDSVSSGVAYYLNSCSGANTDKIFLFRLEHESIRSNLSIKSML
ncbi:hypothetical protein J40TS1_29500 [Paenibacillus montaniterrae]|uniref:DUF4362 domain-containing protein n=1 Tax=Paenibacillus montaniterrae TaxID=429341 RepID=A0A919YNU7_9BACL|nr:DUF4362 domain-containing protein [Paenibacillus montaniterrae]GIP17308.1 hypothetical protein J40TS1_29500 [Paenibacillus montaniterrae]